VGVWGMLGVLGVLATALNGLGWAVRLFRCGSSENGYHNDAISFVTGWVLTGREGHVAGGRRLILLRHGGFGYGLGGRGRRRRRRGLRHGYDAQRTAGGARSLLVPGGPPAGGASERTSGRCHDGGGTHDRGHRASREAVERVAGDYEWGRVTPRAATHKLLHPPPRGAQRASGNYVWKIGTRTGQPQPDNTAHLSPGAKEEGRGGHK